MREIVAGAFVSLDGVMQAPGGPEEDPTGGFEHGGWTVPYWDEPMGHFMDACFSQPFALLLGRKTYEIFAAHWPFVGEDDPIGRVFNEVTKYVATAGPRTGQEAVRPGHESWCAEAVRKHRLDDGRQHGRVRARGSREDRNLRTAAEFRRRTRAAREDEGRRLRATAPS